VKHLKSEAARVHGEDDAFDKVRETYQEFMKNPHLSEKDLEYQKGIFIGHILNKSKYINKTK
jgi:hypothetical protein